MNWRSCWGSVIEQLRLLFAANSFLGFSKSSRKRNCHSKWRPRRPNCGIPAKLKGFYLASGFGGTINSTPRVLKKPQKDKEATVRMTLMGPQPTELRLSGAVTAWIISKAWRRCQKGVHECILVTPQRWELILRKEAWAEMWYMFNGISAGSHSAGLYI